MARRSFAFDGTVVAIGPALSNRATPPLAGQPLAGPPLPLAGVTFRVNTWFRGGTGPTVTVDMQAPATVSSDPLPAYGVGTRLLVSGEPRWGGAPLNAAIAWGRGFTRPSDRSRLGRRDPLTEELSELISELPAAVVCRRHSGEMTSSVGNRCRYRGRSRVSSARPLVAA